MKAIIAKQKIKIDRIIAEKLQLEEEMIAMKE